MSQELSGRSSSTTVDDHQKTVSVSSSAAAGDDSASASAASSPTSRVKFLCSHGGKILLRPPDGHLKYVGGETRVIAVPRDIRFSDLMKKLKAEFESDVVLKYQVVPEDLDILVSVRTDEDLKHMLEEYYRHESEGITKFRAFLFPSNPSLLESPTPISSDPHAAEQRYIDAVNGTTYQRSGLHNSRQPSTLGRPTFSISACNSPNCGSPESNRSDTVSPEPGNFTMNGNNPLSSSKHSMSRVRSSPSLCSLNNYQQQQHSNSSSNLGSNHHQIHWPHPHYYHQQHQLHHPHSYQQQHSKPPSHDPHRLSPGLTFSGRHEMGRGPSSSSAINGHHQYYSSSRHNNNVGMGVAGNKYGYQDEHNGYSPAYNRNFDRMDSLRSSSRMGVDRGDMS
ncbi:unnamed protein product [Linum tenue]|uniref:PB1 domain-containing protein n=1 Tax=Linum tenue TaxID=586396 RepID=A0AAV0GQD1_9ROSI|nr:unnamed protein product [Linum tenue]